jgi:hypothetical protein
VPWFITYIVLWSKVYIADVVSVRCVVGSAWSHMMRTNWISGVQIGKR